MIDKVGEDICACERCVRADNECQKTDNKLDDSARPDLSPLKIKFVALLVALVYVGGGFCAFVGLSACIYAWVCVRVWVCYECV